MQFRKAIGFPFRGPNAWPNLGLVGVCMLIPVVGPIVINGYQVIAEKRLIENLEADVPRFTFNRFSDYLMRGVWPFLAQLVASLVLMPLMVVIMAAFMIGMAMLHDYPAWGVALMIVGFLVYLGAILVLGPLMLPIILRSGLVGTFQAGFDWTFLKDFYRRAGLLTIGVQLLYALMVLPAAIVSLCIPYLGMFAVIVIASFVHTHLSVQLYLTYLERGGVPIAFAPEPPEPGFPVMAGPSPMPPAGPGGG